MQGTLTARGPFEEWPEIKSRQETPLALEHFDRQLVTVIEYRVDLAPSRKATERACPSPAGAGPEQRYIESWTSVQNTKFLRRNTLANIEKCKS
jgi:hypothetical protein